MTVEITDKTNSVEVKYIADNGGSASATVVGKSASDVKESVEQIVAAHDLDTKAHEDGQ